MEYRIHPYYCPDGKVPKDMNWGDKAGLRVRYNALVRDDGMQGFAALGGAVDDSDPDGLLMNPRKRRRAGVLKRMRRADKGELGGLEAILLPEWRVQGNPVRRSSTSTIENDTNKGQERRGVKATAVARTGIDTDDQGPKPGVKNEHIEGPEVIDDDEDDVVGRSIAELGRAAGTREDPVELD